MEWSGSSGVVSLPSPSAMVKVSLPQPNYKERKGAVLDIAEGTGFSLFRSYMKKGLVRELFRASISFHLIYFSWEVLEKSVDF